MSTVLVTGGAGYIGSHAVRALRAAAHTVVVFDDLSAGHAAAGGDATLVEGDVRDTAQVETTLRRHAVTAVMLHATSAAANRGDRKCRNWMSGLILCRTRRVSNRSLRKFA